MMQTCVQGRSVRVLKSEMGYYLGTTDSGFPYCRLSQEYYPTAEEAEEAFKGNTFTPRHHSMEVEFCKNPFQRCLPT